MRRIQHFACEGAAGRLGTWARRTGGSQRGGAVRGGRRASWLAAAFGLIGVAGGFAEPLPFPARLDGPPDLERVALTVRLAEDRALLEWGPISSSWLERLPTSDVLSFRVEQSLDLRRWFSAAEITVIPGTITQSWPIPDGGPTVFFRVVRRITLPGGELAGAVLTGVDLRGADLAGADLSGAELRHTDLGGANLVGARLDGADLWGANLAEANLHGASLVEAEAGWVAWNGTQVDAATALDPKWRLVHALVNGTSVPSDLAAADLSGADLNGVRRPGLNLRGADLTRAKLAHADLSGVDLSGAILVGADLEASDLSGAILERADLALANLHGADLSGARLVFANLAEARLSNANLSGADLTGARWGPRSYYPGILLHETVLPDGSVATDPPQLGLLTQIFLSGPGGLDLRSIELPGVDLKAAELRGADLSQAVFDGGDLSHADLSEADLSAASMRNTRLLDTRLAGANLSGARLEGADLSYANLEGARLPPLEALAGATFFETTMPDGSVRSEAPAP